MNGRTSPPMPEPELASLIANPRRLLNHWVVIPTADYKEHIISFFELYQRTYLKPTTNRNEAPVPSSKPCVKYRCHIYQLEVLAKQDSTLKLETWRCRTWLLRLANSNPMAIKTVPAIRTNLTPNLEESGQLDPSNQRTSPWKFQQSSIEAVRQVNDWTPCAQNNFAWFLADHLLVLMQIFYALALKSDQLARF